MKTLFNETQLQFQLQDLTNDKITEIKNIVFEKNIVKISNNNRQSSLSDFIKFSDKFIDCFQVDPSSYLNRPVLDVSETTYEAVKGHDDVLAHGELYSLPSPPDFLFLFCQKPAEFGGETTIYDGKNLLNSLSQNTLKIFGSRKIKYIHFWGINQWSHYFKTNNFDEILNLVEDSLELKLISADYQNHQIKFEYETFAINEHGAFVNGIINILSRKTQEINHVLWADDEDFSNEMINEINHATNKNEILISWSAGDVIILNNHMMMHGRKSFAGSRQLAVRFGKVK